MAKTPVPFFQQAVLIRQTKDGLRPLFNHVTNSASVANFDDRLLILQNQILSEDHNIRWDDETRYVAINPQSCKNIDYQLRLETRAVYEILTAFEKEGCRFGIRSDMFDVDQIFITPYSAQWHAQLKRKKHPAPIETLCLEELDRLANAHKMERYKESAFIYTTKSPHSFLPTRSDLPDMLSSDYRDKLIYN